MAKVAVLMPAYNAAPFIAAALSSLLRQRDAALLDIIVVDDGSTDETAAIVRGLGAGEIRLIETGRSGIPAARNRALAAIAPDTDFVTFLDADDLSPAGRLMRDLRHFAADPRLDLHYGWIRAFRRSDGADPAAGEPTVDLRTVQLGAALFTAALIRGVGMFDPSLPQSEDTDFMFRTFERRPKYLLVDDICVYYRRHDGGVTRDQDAARRHLSLALLKSIRRRKSLGDFELPADLFNGNALEQHNDVW